VGELLGKLLTEGPDDDEGGDVGTDVGATLGDKVGPSLGEPEGLSVGDKLGAEEGASRTKTVWISASSSEISKISAVIASLFSVKESDNKS